MTQENSEVRLWLHQIGLFSVIPNEGEGDCLFRSISQALSPSTKPYGPGTDLNHAQIRKAVVHHIVNCKWAKFRQRILNHWEPKLTQESSGMQKLSRARRSTGTILHSNPEHVVRKEFARRMSRCQECGTFYELLAAADLYNFHVDYLTRVYPFGSGAEAGDMDDDSRAQLYIFFGCRTNGCNVSRDRPRFIFLYTRYADGAGHWELLRPRFSLEPELSIVPLNRKLCGKIYFPDETDPLESCNSQIPCRPQDEYMQIEAEIRKSNGHLLEDDPDWPADPEDDWTGCAAEDFQPNLIIKRKKSRWTKFTRRVRRFFKCKSHKVHPKLNSKPFNRKQIYFML